MGGSQDGCACWARVSKLLDQGFNKGKGDGYHAWGMCQTVVGLLIWSKEVSFLQRLHDEI